jgi:site-specific recombinase XerD
MIDDMAIRNMSPLTQKAYVRAVKNFSLHFRRSPDALTFEDVRDYQLHLVSRGLEATTINQIMCALRFLYGTTLGKKDASEETAQDFRHHPRDQHVGIRAVARKRR